MSHRFNQIEIFSMITTGLNDLSPGLALSAEKMNALLTIATQISQTLNAPDKPASLPNQGLDAWLASIDTGASSLYMLSVLRPDVLRLRDYAHPHDPSDFIRCLKLLEADPSLRQDLPRMSECSDKWARLISYWQAIEDTLNKEAPDWRSGTCGSAPDTYQLIQMCIEEEEEQ